MWRKPQETADWSHLLKKSLMKKLIFCEVLVIEKSKKISSNWCLGNLSLKNLKFGNAVSKKVSKKWKAFRGCVKSWMGGTI